MLIFLKVTTLIIDFDKKIRHGYGCKRFLIVLPKTELSLISNKYFLWRIKNLKYFFAKMIQTLGWF
jgi:hypothetical protein